MIKSNEQCFQDLPSFFKEGIRVLMLIDRGVQNSNKGSKRWINKIITDNPHEYNIAYDKLSRLQNYLNNPSIRLYASINCRNLEKAINHFNHKQLDLIGSEKSKFYTRINDSFCSCLMKPENRASNNFLLDIDTKDTKEVNSFLSNNRDIVMKYVYPTPQGWHYIVDPFNPRLCFDYSSFEVKKDALMLLRWIDDNGEVISEGK